jgi:hypothetical protein
MKVKCIKAIEKGYGTNYIEGESYDSEFYQGGVMFPIEAFLVEGKNGHKFYLD